MGWSIEEITSTEQDLFWGALDLIAISFPASEKMLPSWFAGRLEGRESGEPHAASYHWLALTDGTAEAPQLVGTALFQLIEEGGGSAAYLWYIAIHPDHRGKSAGGFLYNAVIRHARQIRPEVRTLVFEIEIPEHSTGEDRENAVRRVRFYERAAQGLLMIAKELTYVQEVHEFVAPIEMWLCLDPLGEPMDRREAVLILREIFREGIKN